MSDVRFSKVVVVVASILLSFAYSENILWVSKVPAVTHSRVSSDEGAGLQSGKSLVSDVRFSKSRKLFGPGKLFQVCCVYTQPRGFNSFAGDSLKNGLLARKGASTL